MHDILIRNGLIYDGNGRAPFPADLAVDGDVITAIGRVTGRAPLAITSPEDTLLHDALHIARSGFQEPLKAWVDLLYLARDPRVDLALAARRARAWRAGPSLWACARRGATRRSSPSTSAPAPAR